MTIILLDDVRLAARRVVAARELAPLADSLAHDLEPLLSGEIYFPREKALLSRAGGRCPTHGVYLEFDPFKPHDHRCPICGEVYQGPLHDRFWIYWYQLWLAERAVHASLLHALGGDDRFCHLAQQILNGYLDRYHTYPNVDNVLGPTRLFFSTYLESIWLLQLCIATDLIADCDPVLTSRVIAEIIAPSAELIASYDEGMSNRQVWNDVALLAASQLLDDPKLGARAVNGPSGLVAHLTNGLLPDGTWYEGENYHLFAHRGLWYGVTIAERVGLEIPKDLVDRFQLGFATPFATALPDFTLPSRRDSQYAISLRQWRIAEHCELGFARRDDDALLGALQRMYGDDVPRQPTGRFASSADVERNAKPSALSRADLSWRALLFAKPTLPRRETLPPQSTLLNAQGIAVFRRDAGQAYVALDYGHSGGGHGHPDRLNLLLADGNTRWLDDFGTGSYVDRSLHWYRSTLAHNAPLVNGRSQDRVHGSLIAFDERGGAGWISAVANELAPGVTIKRTLIVMSTYAIDVLEWKSDTPISLDLPMHVSLDIAGSAIAPTSEMLTGGNRLEDGFDFLSDVRGFDVARGVIVRGTAKGAGHDLDVRAASSRDTQWWSATAPGAPGAGEHRFWLVRTKDSTGVHRTIWSWGGEIRDVEFADSIRVRLHDGTVHTHSASDAGWHIDLAAGSGRSSIDLAGFATFAETEAAPYHAPERAAIVLTADGEPTILHLGADHYRRSESAWETAGSPTAAVALSWKDHVLTIDVDVPMSDLAFAAQNAVNAYDNEPADINGDGVQLYLRTHDGDSGWLLVPDSASDHVRIRSIEAWTSTRPVVASWQRAGKGYTMRIEVAGDTPPLALDLVVNEMPRGRERRRGQLVMSGAIGEFIYLRGDRHEAARLVPLRLTDA
jgi:hypothetical protein